MTSLENRLPNVGLKIAGLGGKGDEEAVDLFEKSSKVGFSM